MMDISAGSNSYRDDKVDALPGVSSEALHKTKQRSP